MTNLKKYPSNQAAFTMIELVFAIVVMGILAALAMPRLDRDLKQEAADSILADIRYTQHLALVDHKHSFDNASWQSAFWRIGFDFCSGDTDYYEYIGSDANYANGIENNEAALDPTNGKPMLWSNSKTCADGGDGVTSNRIFLTDKYGITNIAFTGSGINSCAHDTYIGFDHLGRPHQGFASITGAPGSVSPDYSSYMDEQCTITFTMTDNDTFSIIIEEETGQAYILGQEDS